MKDSLLKKLDIINDRFDELSALLSDHSIINDQKKFRIFSKEYAELEPVVKCYQAYCKANEDIIEAQDLVKDNDPEIREIANEALLDAKKNLNDYSKDLKILLLPNDPNDKNNIFLEIRAGTGGDEAAIFAGDLFRMYSRFAEEKAWKVEILNKREGEHGGFKEIISRISGTDVYAQLKFESGAHRVQRVPATESQGRVHTSACTVAVMPEADDIEEIEINKSDIRIDTFRASGAGGQHVNKTDSAIRITHLPSGVVVECQDERSQHKNKARALSLLQARLAESVRIEAEKEKANERRVLVGSGDRSERIRTYNFPQGRLTDHRINLTIYKLGEVIEGQLQQVIQPLINEYQADMLSELGE